MMTTRPKISILPASDDLFTPKQHQLLPRDLSRCTCRVCERPGARAKEGHQICAHCTRDTVATKAHITHLMAGYSHRIEETWCAFQQALPESPYQLPDGRYGTELSEQEWNDHRADLVATNSLRKRWDGYWKARGTPVALQAEEKARHGMPGPLADLIRLWLDYQQANAVYTERQVWAERAELALNVYLDEVADAHAA